MSSSAALAIYSGTVTSFCCQAKNILRRSTAEVSGTEEMNRVSVVKGKHCAVGDAKYRFVAATKEAVVLDSAEPGSELVVNSGGLDEAIEERRRRRGSLVAILLGDEELEGRWTG